MTPRYRLEAGTNCWYIVNSDTGRYVAKSIGDSEESYVTISSVMEILNDAVQAAAN